MSEPKIAYYDFDCEECLGTILEDDEFYFMPDKEGGYIKVCQNCYLALTQI